MSDFVIFCGFVAVAIVLGGVAFIVWAIRHRTGGKDGE